MASFQQDYPNNIKIYRNDSSLYITGDTIKIYEYNIIYIPTCDYLTIINTIERKIYKSIIIDNIVSDQQTSGYDDLMLLILSLRRFSDENTEISLKYIYAERILLSLQAMTMVRIISETNNIFSFLESVITPKNVTVVTSLYNIRGHESHGKQMLVNDYIKKGESLLYIDAPIIVYTDKETYKPLIKLFEKRTDVLIIINDLDKTPFNKDIPRLRELQQHFNIPRSLIKDTPEYIALTNNKMYFIEKAMELNPNKSTHFLWLDFGISKNNRRFYLINSWIHFVPDKIRQMFITAPTKNMLLKESHKTIRHYNGAGLFSASIEYMKKYINEFSCVWRQVLEDSWWQLDESIMSIVYTKNKDLFEPYFGDYFVHIESYEIPTSIDNFGILKNYLCCVLDYRQYSSVQKVMDYIECHYAFHPNNNYHLFYIKMGIIAYFYINDGVLPLVFVDSINYLKKSNQQLFNNIITSNVKNFEYYKNKSLIL